jgi:hypothetical protein
MSAARVMPGAIFFSTSGTSIDAPALTSTLDGTFGIVHVFEHLSLVCAGGVAHEITKPDPQVVSTKHLKSLAFYVIGVDGCITGVVRSVARVGHAGEHRFLSV